LHLPPDAAAILAGAKNKMQLIDEALEEGVITIEEHREKGVSVMEEAASLVASKWRSWRESLGNCKFLGLAKAKVIALFYLRGLIGIRGAMARADGVLTAHAIRHTLAQGLTPHEFFMRSVEVRRALPRRDARRTRSVELLRSLVQRLGAVQVAMKDCDTAKGVAIEYDSVSLELGRFRFALRDRVVCCDVIDPRNKEVLARRGTLIDDRLADVIDDAGVCKVIVRSPAFCESPVGVCAQCMGVRYESGEHVGVSTALRIGYGARHLTGKTFHVGC
jgi:DNA-directed RNA polymerase subunit beta'